MKPYTSSWMDDASEIFRDSVRKFIAREFAPHYERWNKQQQVDRDAWIKAGEMGMLCPDIPKEYGGGGTTFAYDAIVLEELARSGNTSFGNAIQSIVAHYILAYGTEAQKRLWLPKLGSGETVAAIAMSEPGAGSDLQSIKTRAIRDGNQFIINGTKTFISNGIVADLICLVVKTDPEEGAKSISLIMVETAELAGFSRGRPLKKLGQHGQDTAELYFNDVYVPTSCLLGTKDGGGFAQLMQQLPHERLIVAVSAVAAAERAIEITLEYVKQRKAFGKSIFEFQNTRFQLAECRTEAMIGRVFVDYCIQQLVNGELDPVSAAMAKWWLTEKQFEIADRCLQLHGGYGYMLEYPIAQLFIDSRVQRIYGGSNEIMKELIARNL